MEKDSRSFWPPAFGRGAGLLALLLALTEVFIDWGTHIDLNVSIVYGLPLVVAAATRSRRLLWGLTAFLVLMTFAVYAVQMHAGVFSPREPFFVNRVLAALALVLTAGLLHAGLIGIDLLESQRRSLKEQNEELEHRRREAEEASSRKTRFLAAASHDIRTPVNTISLMAEVLCRAADHPELAVQIPDIAHRLQANALALADLVGDVLDVARLDAVRVELQVSEFSLNELLAQECARALPLAQAKDLRLEVNAPADALRLRTDRVKLDRVIGNLLGNAIKFTDAGGVTVSAARAADGAALICVRDTGVGIALAELGHIFDEFVQLGNPERDRAKGCGLGLAICRRLTEALGGGIAVESEPGRGSAFTVRLPPSCVVEGPGGAPAPAEGRRLGPWPGRSRLSGLHVLLVEDDQPTRESTAHILRGEGAVVREAADCATARRLLREEAWEAVLLDMVLPDFDGREILQELAAHRPPSLGAVYVTTGDLTGARRAEVQRLGADRLLGKPIDTAELIALLEEVRPGAGRP
jgi:signal transduction histidine kinase